MPWVKPIGDLLREMQLGRIHMAMVVDEYGGFMGVVTLEDILREIVGDIADEFEVEEKLIEKQADGSFLVDAGLEVEEFQKAFAFNLPEGEFETLGGFLELALGQHPRGRRAVLLQRLAVHRPVEGGAEDRARPPDPQQGRRRPGRRRRGEGRREREGAQAPALPPRSER